MKKKKFADYMGTVIIHHSILDGGSNLGDYSDQVVADVSLGTSLNPVSLFLPSKDGSEGKMRKSCEFPSMGART